MLLAAALDILIAAGIILSIYYYNYLAPHKFDIPATIPSGSLTADNAAMTEGGAPETLLSLAPAQNTPAQPNGTGMGVKFAGKFSDTPLLTDHSYRSKDLAITVTAHETGKGEDKVTYYVADIYTSNINCFKTYFSQNTYGTGYTEHLTNMSADVGAVLAMNGDSYCYNRQHTAGVLIRNGKVYRTEPTTSDVCVLYRDGTMKTFSPDQFNLEQVMRDGAYQSWTFGPNLLDAQGKAMTTFNTWDYIRKPHPRSAIGYYEPGHYCFVVVDGRQSGYSRGMTLTELAKVFESLGCSAAYSLDGGHSTFMTFNSQVVNQPYKPTHKIVDCLYFGEV